MGYIGECSRKSCPTDPGFHSIHWCNPGMPSKPPPPAPFAGLTGVNQPLNHLRVNKKLKQVGVGSKIPQPDTPPPFIPGLTATTPEKVNGAKRKTALSGRGGRSSGVGVRDGKGQESEDLLLPATETRSLELKNHFPVAMRLRSLAMEDCQVRDEREGTRKSSLFSTSPLQPQESITPKLQGLSR